MSADDESLDGSGSEVSESSNGEDAGSGPVGDARSTKGTKTRAPRWRRALVVVLVVIGCILAPLAMAGVWLKAQILDTDTYVSTMAPLSENPDVQNALATRITNALVADTSLQDQVADRLPERAQLARRRWPARRRSAAAVRQ